MGPYRALRMEGDIRKTGCGLKAKDGIELRELPHLCKKPGGCSRPAPDDDLLMVRDLPSLSRARAA